MKYDAEQIGKRIREERIKMGLTQKELGQKLNIVPKQISTYESGKQLPPLNMMLNLCSVFSCELGYLLGEEKYSEGTQLETAIIDSTGLSHESLENIRRITGTGKKCLDFGHESESYRSILNNLLSMPQFLTLIECIKDLDRFNSKYKNAFSDVEKEVGTEIFERAMDLYQSGIPFEDPNYDSGLSPDDPSPTIIDSAINQKIDYSYDIKVARYELHEAFEDLINTLYPKI